MAGMVRECKTVRLIGQLFGRVTRDSRRYEMPSMSNLATAMLLSVTTVGAGQSVPATVEAAEAEAKSFPHGTWPAAVSSLFAQSFGGSAERKCVAPPSRDDSVPNGSMRSGEFIIRTRFAG